MLWEKNRPIDWWTNKGWTISWFLILMHIIMKLQLWEMTKMKQKIKNIYSTKYETTLNSVSHENYFRYIKDLNHIWKFYKYLCCCKLCNEARTVHFHTHKNKPKSTKCLLSGEFHSMQDYTFNCIVVNIKNP